MSRAAGRSRGEGAARRRTATALLPAALATALLVSGCSQQAPAPSHSKTPSGPDASAAPGKGDGNPGNTPGTAHPSPSRQLAGKVDFTDPEDVAVGFVFAYVQRNWATMGPASYLKQLKPFVTTAFWKKTRRATSDHCDVTCRQSKKKRVRVSADDPKPVIPGEAPRSKHEVWVQVSYEEVTSWAGGGDSTTTGTVLKLHKEGGRWLVAEREQTR